MEYPEDFEVAHQEVLSGIESLLGFPPKRLDICPLVGGDHAIDPNYGDDSLGHYLRRRDEIEIRRELFLFSEPNPIEDTAGYKNVEVLFTDHEVPFDKRLCFKVVTTHEYLHAHQQHTYWTELLDMLSNRILVQPPQLLGGIPLNGRVIERLRIRRARNRIVRGIDEGFAFWGTDRIFGVKCLNDDRMTAYRKEYGTQMADAMQFFYDTFHAESQTNGDIHVIENFHEIVETNLAMVHETH